MNITHRALSSSALAAVVALSVSVVSQTALAAPTREPDTRPARATRPPPVASTGFQMHLRTGVSFPVGAATGADSDLLGDRYAWQVPIYLGMGAKITRSVYVGAYVHLGIGAEGSDSLVEGICDDNDNDLENDVSCSVLTARVGLEGQYHFEPAEWVNPWIGYGIGYEGATQSIQDREHGYEESHTASGITFAQLAGGLDYRMAKGIGGGPFLEAAIGRFTRTTTRVNSEEVHSGSIDEPAVHAWISLGLRLTVRP